MTLTVTAGSATADSYCSLTDAETYIGSLYYASDWTGKSDANKEKVLKQATRLLDTLWWQGTKAESTQALEWPRAYIVDRNGYAVSSTTIPTWLANATAEFALRLLAADRAGDQGHLVPDSAKLGPLEVGRMQRRTIPASVWDLITPYVLSDPTSCQVIRA
jgi:hypothetical protein